MYYRIILCSKKKYYHQNSMLNFKIFFGKPSLRSSFPKNFGGGVPRFRSGGGGRLFLGGMNHPCTTLVAMHECKAVQ
jgi:hypothetical protein